MADELTGVSEMGVKVPDLSSSKSSYSLKRQAIIEACHGQDIARLQRLASDDGGFLEDNLRQSAWPLLLGCDHHCSGSDATTGYWRDLPPHPDEEQVQKDVERAFVFYPSNESQKSIDTRKVELLNLIVRVLRMNRMLHYFQGYHDIVQVFLLALGEKAAFPAVSHVSFLRIRDYMLSSIRPAEVHLHLIPAILKTADPALAAHISQTPPFFALPATITLWAHEIPAYKDIARLFDFILAYEPVLTVYLFTSLIVSRRDELLEIPSDDPDMLLFTLSKLPPKLDIEILINEALSLHSKYSPEQLPGNIWRSISSYSVLKTSRDISQPQTLDAARRLFELQSKQLYREELKRMAFVYLSRRRKPIISIGATVFIGMMSFWLRKSGYDRVFWSSLWWLIDQMKRR